MKHEQSAQAGYRPRFDGTTKLYLSVTRNTASSP